MCMCATEEALVFDIKGHAVHYRTCSLKTASNQTFTLANVAVCCSVLQCVSLCCSVLQCIAEFGSELPFVAVRCSVLQWLQLNLLFSSMLALCICVCA